MVTKERRPRFFLTKDSIPVWVQIRRNKITLVDRHQATYVLVHIFYATDKMYLQGMNKIRVGQHLIQARIVDCEELQLVYLRVDAESATLPPLIKRAVSGMYSMVDGYDFSDPDTTQYLRRAFDTDAGVLKHAPAVKPPYEGEFPRSKITAEHHTHFRPEEVWEAMLVQGDQARPVQIILDRLRKIEGVTEAVVATFMLYAMTARYQVAAILATSRVVWSATNVGELADVLKRLATPLKSMHNPDVCDLTQMFELQCLVNRGVGGINWDTEYLNRVRPNVIEVNRTDVYKHALEVFQQGVRLGYRYRKLRLDEYVDARWEWVPNGSVHSQYKEDEKYIPQEYRHRSKFAAMNMMPREHIFGMFKRTPEIHSWASVKYEWAKQRAIYGVDLTSSVVTNLAMYRCEEVFKHRFPVGEEAAAERVHKRLSMMLTGAESFCYDFDDFNAQHSTESMQAVLEAYRDAFSDEMSDDQRMAMEWTIRSLDQVVIHNNEGGPAREYKLAGTLLSGWRLTTFMNTALNYVYFKIAGALDTAGVIDSVHNGDDVLVSISTLKAAVDIQHKMQQINARAQPTKCNIFSVGEFLRVDHKISKEEGLGAQYLTRSCATSVHSRVESQAPTRFIDSIKAVVSRANDLIARARECSKALDMLVKIALRNIAKVFEQSYEHAVGIVNAHYLVGGCQEGLGASIDYEYVEHVEYEDLDNTVSPGYSESILKLLNPGINDYARVLDRQFGDAVNFGDVRRKVVSATRRQLAVTRKTRLQVTEVPTVTRYTFGRALYKMYAHLVNIPHLEKARFVGIQPIALLDARSKELVRAIITAAEDVDYTLRALL